MGRVSLTPLGLSEQLDEIYAPSAADTFIRFAVEFRPAPAECRSSVATDREQELSIFVGVEHSANAGRTETAELLQSLVAGYART